MTKKHLTTIVALLFVSTISIKAQTDPILHYDFSSTSGTTVHDISASGIDATMKGSAKVEQMGNFKVMNLGKANGYLDMTAQAGQLFNGLTKFSIAVYYRVDEEASLSGNGYFLWNFSNSTSCTNTSGAYMAYRLNAQRMANATSGYNTEQAVSIDSQASKGSWYHVVYRQNGASGQLLINGKVMKTNSNMHTISEMFGNTMPKYCYIGRAPFSGDNYLANTLVYDVRIYDRWLTDSEVQNMADNNKKLDYAYRYGQVGDFSTLKAAINEAETFLSSENLNEYPISAVYEFQDIITICNLLCEEGLASQTIIDNHTKMIKAAKQKLTITKGFSFDTSAVYEGYDINRGFRHPGGLHTYKDFERIRQQIANNNPMVTAAYNILKNAEYAQSTTATYPTEIVVRGGGVGENYINCCRGATIAYQNALRWQIEGNRECAQHAVDVLMQWARTTKSLGGDSNYALAAGLYGYEFAQAAELVRDYDGWAKDDFNLFRRWMIDVWYSAASGFLRGRNGTWENYYGQGGERPGHYWSNWGLCNALCVLSVGILCDDVFIYNQAMSFLKYDQTGTFNFNRENTAGPIYNYQCNEFWGGLIPVVHDDERGPYGKLGQMQEDGRDQGHANMALGLAIDCAETAWNQGDNLYGHMNNRLAAGTEWQAAWNASYNSSTETNEIDLPWTEYVYNAAASAWHNSWVQSAAAPGYAFRNYWGRVIGHYEGRLGHNMPYSEINLSRMGIDGGGGGSTSGGYDHLGYSVLTCTYNNKASKEQVPTLLKPHVEYSLKGKNYSLDQSEVGGLNNKYVNHITDAIPRGTVIKLMPQINDTENTGDDGNGTWKWDTGETTKDITITADRSQLYRVTYTNKNGVESEQVFSIAVADDCETVYIRPTITVDDVDYQTESMDIPFGKSVKLSAYGMSYYGYYQWDNGQKTESIEIPAITRSRDVEVTFINAGGRTSILTFHLNVIALRPDAVVDNITYTNQDTYIVKEGSNVVLTPIPTETLGNGTFHWNLIDNKGNVTNLGESETLSFNGIDESKTVSVTYSINGIDIQSLTYEIYVKEANDRILDNGDYVIIERETGKLLTNCGDHVELKNVENLDDDMSVWSIEHSSLARYNFISKADGQYLRDNGTFAKTTLYPMRIKFAAGTDYAAISNRKEIYFTIENNNINFNGSNTLDDFPFLIIPADKWTTDIDTLEIIENAYEKITYYDINGIRLNAPRKGINIIKTNNGKTKKIFLR